MKNITMKLFIIIICMISFSLQAQVSPVNKEMSDKLEQQRRDYIRNQKKSNSEIRNKDEKNRSYKYVNLTIEIINEKYEVSEIIIDEKGIIDDKSKLQKVKFLQELSNLLNKGALNIVGELGKQGIKIISHSFIPVKKGEKHIYILEL